MQISDWIEKELCPVEVDSVDLIYDGMESQSGESLPIIYQPFDAGERMHWCERGSAFDFLASCGAGKLLDFGPGDGWPSLIVAPYVSEVIGVDASRKRVEVCTANAERMGIGNASFCRVAVGEPLPFPDQCFDGVMAASSVEQTPDPQATLRELYRVLKLDGRLRIFYEALDGYRGQRERNLEVWPTGDSSCRLLLTFHDCDEERTLHYGLTFAIAAGEVKKRFGAEERLRLEQVDATTLMAIRSEISDARRCRLSHPSGKSYLTLMQNAGFRKLHPTRDGSGFAGRLFDSMPAAQRPKDLEEVDQLLRPGVAVTVLMAASISENPWITAVK